MIRHRILVPGFSPLVIQHSPSHFGPLATHSTYPSAFIFRFLLSQYASELTQPQHHVCWSRGIPIGHGVPSKGRSAQDFYRPLPKIAPRTVDPAAVTDDEPTTYTQAVLNALNAALASSDAEKVAGCFCSEQAFWRDIVAFTSHLRTFIQPDIVAAPLLQMKSLRGIEGEIKISGHPHFVFMSPR